MSISSGEPTKLLRISEAEFAPYIPGDPDISLVGILKAMIAITEVAASLLVPGALATGVITLSSASANLIVDATIGEISAANTAMNFGFSILPIATFIKTEMKFIPYSKYSDYINIQGTREVFERVGRTVSKTGRPVILIGKRAETAADIPEMSEVLKAFIRANDPTSEFANLGLGARQVQIKKYVEKLRKELQAQLEGLNKIPRLNPIPGKYWYESRNWVKEFLETERMLSSIISRFANSINKEVIASEIGQGAVGDTLDRQVLNANQQALLEEMLAGKYEEMTVEELSALVSGMELTAEDLNIVKSASGRHPINHAMNEEGDRFNAFKILKTRRDANGKVTYRFNPLSRKWWGSAEGSNFTQAAQLSNPTDLAREMVQTPYRMLSKMFNKEEGILGRYKYTKWLGKVFKGYNRATKKLAEHLNGKLIYVNSQWIAGYRVFKRPDGKFILMVFLKTQMSKPRLINGVTHKLLKAWIQAPSKGSFYKKRFALSTNGRDIVSGEVSLASALFPLGPARNFFSVYSNFRGQFEEHKLGWTERFESALQRNFQTKVGRATGMFVGGNLGGKIGTAMSKTIVAKKKGLSTKSITNDLFLSTTKSAVLKQSRTGNKLTGVRRNRNRYKIYRRAKSIFK